MPTYDKSLPKLNKRGSGRGRPAKRSEEVEKILLDAISDGAPYIVACSCAGISQETFFDWRRRDAEFNDQVEKASAACTMRRVRKIERHGEETFAALAWLLERRHPELFSRPEVQLNLITQNTTENHLTINISGTEATAIECQAQPVRDAVGEMFAKYRPIGNGETGIREIEAAPVSETVREPPPITHHGTDERNPAFWKMLVSAAPSSKVTKPTAEFIVRTLLMQLQGYKAHRTSLNFTEPVAVEDVFGRLEKLCGGPSGWQLAQRLGGYAPSKP